MQIVLGVSGSIAAYKACLLLRRFTESGHDVNVVPTAAALKFVGASTWSALSGKPVSDDVWTRVEEVRHVRLGQTADLVVVAPATADLLAKVAHGLADDLLTNILLTAHYPVVLAPAMHTEMWQHAATVANVAMLRSRDVYVIEPDSGRLTGIDTGLARLPEVDAIASYCEKLMGRADHSPLTGRRVVVSAGGTREPLDPVRFLGNRSSGKQGYALAAVAIKRGAQVTLISANVTLTPPPGVDVVEVETTLELQAAVNRAASDADAVLMAAAPVDFRPVEYQNHKIKKADSGVGLVLDLVENPDIIKGLVVARAERTLPVIVSFAAETGDVDASVMEHARAKFARKGSDLQIVNEVGPRVTFGQDVATVRILRRDGDAENVVGPVEKATLAAAIWDAIQQLLLSI